MKKIKILSVLITILFTSCGSLTIQNKTDDIIKTIVLLTEEEQSDLNTDLEPVSYTHLTLPTIYSV